MEQAEILGNFINTYGFPIVVCGLLFWYIFTEQREQRKTSEKLADAINEALEYWKGEKK